MKNLIAKELKNWVMQWSKVLIKGCAPPRIPIWICYVTLTSINDAGVVNVYQALNTPYLPYLFTKQNKLFI